MMMREFAQKLMALDKLEEKSSNLSVILGRSSDLAASLTERAQIRVGMWPAISTEEPYLAMGLMTTLAYLLERWQGITVYRIFSQLDNDASDFAWDISKSQFELEDWQIEGLDDNVGMWGSLDSRDHAWVFTVEVESDLADADEPLLLSHEAATMSEIINWLPSAAQEIVTYLGVTSKPVSSQPLYSTTTERDGELVAYLLVDLFEWEIKLILTLWGQTWDLATDYPKLVENPHRAQDDFAAWAVANAVARAMQPGFIVAGGSVPPYQAVVDYFGQSQLPAVILAGQLYTSGAGGEATGLLEREVERHPDSTTAWLNLATLHRLSGNLLKAIDIFQQAIEVKAVNVALYANYAQLLPVMETAGWIVDEFVLIDPDELAGNYMVWEAIEAYGEALKLIPENENPSALLAAKASLLVDICESDAEFQRLWHVFTALVNSDESGEYVRLVIDGFYNLEDFEAPLKILETAVDANPLRCDLHINLAATYLVAEYGEDAVEELEAARKLTDDPQIHAEIDRLMLSASDPQFEQEMGDIIDKVNAGTGLNSDEIEFLEDTIDAAPQYNEAYLMLAKAYVIWNDGAMALNTLLDAQKQLPDDPEILEALSKILWERGETESAMNYAKLGLSTNPNFVPLLALMGQFLFEEGERELARGYLARAEALSSNHPALARVRTAIARILSQEGE